MEGVLQIVTWNCAHAARDHAEVAAEVLVAMFAVTSDWFGRTTVARPDIQPARYLGRAGNIARLLDQIPSIVRHIIWISCAYALHMFIGQSYAIIYHP